MVAELQLHDIDAHGRECETENEIDDGEEHHERIFWHEITETLMDERRERRMTVDWIFIRITWLVYSPMVLIEMNTKYSAPKNVQSSREL